MSARMDQIKVKNLNTGNLLPTDKWAEELNSLKSKELVLITGNVHKYEELKSTLPDGIHLSWLKLDLLEIQHSNPLEIVKHKCLEARQRYSADNLASVPMIEDVCLNFKALNGLPGPYIKWFVDSIGQERLPRLLDGFEDKGASAICTYGLIHGDYIIFCSGIVDGTIVEPRGTSWGWDPIFQESSTHKTFAELGIEKKRAISHRAKAVDALTHFLKSI